ncbi:hypothetical protein N6H13_14475 [Paenibacillus sp. CC-CFT742]|nr:hypothetical protein [Paenibacillus sp. CC-CFT742]WJH31620.1 hypothetical protein N6H13_14475 [Paenibacillus sp. CC-CFT742]
MGENLDQGQAKKAAKPVKQKDNKAKKKNKKKGFVWSIRNKLLVSFLAVLLVPSLIIGMITLLIADRTVEGQLMDSAKQSVSTTNSIIETHVNAKIHDINYFAESIRTDMLSGDGGLSALEVKLQQYVGLHPDALNIFVGTEDGTMVRGKKKPAVHKGPAMIQGSGNGTSWRWPTRASPLCQPCPRIRME